LGWFFRKSENIPIEPDLGNASEAIKRALFKGFGIYAKTLVFYVADLLLVL
jgi:hypothetical protein